MKSKIKRGFSMGFVEFSNIQLGCFPLETALDKTINLFRREALSHSSILPVTDVIDSIYSLNQKFQE